MFSWTEQVNKVFKILLPCFRSYKTCKDLQLSTWRVLIKHRIVLQKSQDQSSAKIKGCTVSYKNLFECISQPHFSSFSQFQSILENDFGVSRKIRTHDWRTKGHVRWPLDLEWTFILSRLKSNFVCFYHFGRFGFCSHRHHHRISKTFKSTNQSWITTCGQSYKALYDCNLRL